MDEAQTAFQRIMAGEQFGNIGLLIRINFVNAQKNGLKMYNSARFLFHLYQSMIPVYLSVKLLQSYPVYDIPQSPKP